MSEHLKNPLSSSLNRVAVKRASDAIAKTGRALPCTVVAVVSSGIVTVNFEVDASPATLGNVTIPIEYPEYLRYPIQVGDKGMTVPADTLLGGLTGLGAGTPKANVAPANLSGLSFVFLGSTGWSATDDAQASVLYGPNGVILRDTAKTHTLTLSTANGINLDSNVTVKGNQLAFFGGSPVTKKTITGALSAVTDTNAKAVLTSIIALITGYTFGTNGTT